MFLPNSDFDALIAALHPHIIMSLFNSELKPPRALRSRNLQGGMKDLRMLAQAFATLFHFHPKCDAAAVAVQFTKPGRTTFSICLSPSTPADFHSTLDKWLAHLTALLRVDESEFKGNASGYQEDSLSSSEEQFILLAYKACYPAMHQLIAEHGFGDWKIFVEEDMTIPRRSYWVPIGEEVQLAEQYKTEIRALTRLVKGFAEKVLHDSLGEDHDVLEFHKLCMHIRDMRSNEGFLDYLDTYIHPGIIEPGLAYFDLPLAVSTIIAISRRKEISPDDVKRWVVLDPLKDARRFSAVITDAFLAEHFKGEHAIQWKAVVDAFKQNWAAGHFGFQVKYRWDADEHTLSTASPVLVHPEVTLIQHLLDSADSKDLKGAKAHVACSRTPCYASAAYAVAVNESLGTRFTMDVDDPHWCRLEYVEPWILPGDAPPAVVKKMEEHLLQDLGVLIVRWMEINNVYYSTASSENSECWWD